MPAGIYPLPFAVDEDFGDAAGLVEVLAPGFQLVRIVRINHRGGAINLDFGFGKLELDEFAAPLRKLRGAIV